ncbi:transposase, partial [Streptomyces sp. SID339]|nr:transposase [Streptomyces sp. SID339]
RLGPVARAAAGEVAGEEPAGLGPGGDRLLARPGCPPGPKSGPSPVDRARPGSKHHLLVDGQGIPLAVSLTGGNRNDVTQLLPLPGKIRPSRAGSQTASAPGCPAGRPWLRPRHLPAPAVAARHPARGRKTGRTARHRPGHLRYVVERTIAWLHGFRRLRIRWERRDDIHEA